MKKLLFLILGLVFLATPVENFNQNFLDEVKDSYSEYSIVCNYNSDNYSIIIVKGIVNNKATYGISFFSQKANQYYFRFNIGDNSYKTSANIRGDISIIALNWKDYSEVEIAIYDKNGNLQHPSHLTKLTKFDANEFVGLSEGNNKGTSLISLKKNSNIFGTSIIIVISLIIILICAIVMLVLRRNKKGFFASERRKEGTLNIKELISGNNEPNDNEWIDVKNLNENTENELNEKEDVLLNEKVDAEDIVDLDVEKYLKDAGFITDYNIASEDEKNMIMLELMKLRDGKKISKDKYLEETYKLWKK